MFAGDMFDSRIWRVKVANKGREGEPVAAIDGFAADPAALVEAASRAEFSGETGYYPGIRADLESRLAEAMRKALEPIAAAVFGASKPPELLGCYYSLVTTPPEQLAPIQRLPHFDGVEAERLALILYLCAPEHGGTSFYRHKATGFETVSAERLAGYGAALEADVRTHGLPPPCFIHGETPMFERIGGSEAAFNRALVYRGRNLHSGDIGAGFAFDPNPRTGRLTLNAFLL